MEKLKNDLTVGMILGAPISLGLWALVFTAIHSASL